MSCFGSFVVVSCLVVCLVLFGGGGGGGVFARSLTHGNADAPCEHGSVGETSTVCSQIVLKCLCLARIGRPDILYIVCEQTCSCGHELDKSM